jgi:hypothetical protein
MVVWLEVQLKAAGLDARPSRVDTVQVTLSPDDFGPQDALLHGLLTQAVADQQN